MTGLSYAATTMRTHGNQTVTVAVSTAGLLGQHNTIASEEIIQGGVLAAMLSLICSAKHKSQLAGLQVLSSLALVSSTAAKKLLSQRLLAALEVSHVVLVSLLQCNMYLLLWAQRATNCRQSCAP